jgi:SAM-dependent methyltransferase
MVAINSPREQETGTLNDAGNIESHAGAAFYCKQITSALPDREKPLKILVAGCGAGHEAVAIQACLAADVDAVDVEDFVPAGLRESSPVRFALASVCELPFADGQFDSIFYHHVIEHVDDPAKSLGELARVLRPGGLLFVGAPNRHRLASSIGAHQQSTWNATFSNKLRDNARDWRDRLTGRFRNELGAHAGFSRNELDRMLALHFADRRWLTEDYLRHKYASHRWSRLVPLVTHPSICWFAAPAIYVLCRKPG